MASAEDELVEKELENLEDVNCKVRVGYFPVSIDLKCC